MLQKTLLYNKIKIACEPEKTVLSEQYLDFYSKYSRFVLKALRKSSFQTFVYWMLLSENIAEQAISTVDIKVFPASGKNGFVIVGKCNTFKGRIRIYPKPSYFCGAFSKKFGKNVLISFVGNRARAALVHELLHLKYASDELTVRKLTEAYFSVYMKRHITKNSVFLQDLIFSSQKPSLY